MSLKTINLKIMETKEQKENDYRKFRLMRKFMQAVQFN